MQLDKLQIDFCLQRLKIVRVDMGYPPRNWNWQVDFDDFDTMISISQLCIVIPKIIMEVARTGQRDLILAILSALKYDIEQFKERKNTQQDFTLRNYFKDGSKVVSSIDGDRFFTNAFSELYGAIQSIIDDDLTLYEQIASRFWEISKLLTDIYVMVSVYLFYVYPTYVASSGYQFENLLDIIVLIEYLRNLANSADESQEKMKSLLCLVFDANRQSA